MPRADTTPTRRTKRDGRQPVTQKLARTAASVRAAAMANMSAGGQSISAPPIIKRESVPTPMPPRPAASAKTPVSSSPQRGWRHPDELAYIKSAGKTWDDMAIIRFAAANAAFSVPARGTNSMEPWVHVRLCGDGSSESEVVLPRGYRLPLLWVAKYLWTSVKLVLTADEDIRQREWDTAKFEVLHIARLCATLLSKAQAHMDEAGVMDRAWRCAQFDRALHRYWHDWLVMRDEYLRDFFREFGEEEYQRDVLKLTWSRWVLKGHKGFSLTAAECANGISAEEFMKGLLIDNDAGTFEWSESRPNTPSEAQMDVAKEDVTPAKETPPITVDVPVIQTATVVTESTPAPPQVVSFLVRPRNTFRAASKQSLQEVNLKPVSSDEDSVSAPMVKEPVSVLVQPDHAASPADVSMSVDPTDNSVAQSQDRTPSDVFARLQHPNGHGDGFHSEAKSQTTPIERSREGSTSAQIEGDGEMQVDTPARAAPVASVALTAMGSLRPGSAVLRGHSEEAGNPNVDISEPRVEGEAEEEEDSEEEESEDEEMAHVPQNPEMRPGIVTEDLDEEDLELLYPDQEDDPPAGDHPPESHTAPPNTTPSASTSTSRSVSPVPPLSSARFPTTTYSEDSTTSTQLTVYPHASQASEAADPGIIARFLQSCGILGEEMRALRSEVAQLRQERGAPVMQLEERVRRLEERAPLPERPPLSVHPSGHSGGAGRRWSHPLEHLMSPDNSEMDVDAPVGNGNGTTTTLTRYGSVDGHGEPLPPRSRKFNSAQRLPAA